MRLEKWAPDSDISEADKLSTLITLSWEACLPIFAVPIVVVNKKAWDTVVGWKAGDSNSDLMSAAGG